MKYTVSLLLLVAIGHAAEPSRSEQDEDDNKAAKREFLEGNYGLRIQPSVLENDIQSKEPELDSKRSTQQKNVPSQDNGPPRVSQQEYLSPLVKISDVLTGEGPSFPAAIAGHLYSPVSVYQPRLGSPTTFEIARPIPSQLGYSEHKIFNDNFLQDFQQNQDFESLKQQQSQSFTNFQQHDYERQISKNTNQNFNPVPFNSGQPLINTQEQSYKSQGNLLQSFELQKNSTVLNQNAESTKHSNAEQARQNEQLQNFEPAKLSQSEQQQQQSLHQNLSASTELQPSRPDITEPLPRLETFQPQTRPIYSEQIIQQIFPQVEELPSDFFQQINQLGNQLANTEETVQYIQNPVDEQANREAEKKENEKSEQQNDQSRQQTTTERQASASQEQSSTAAANQNTQFQATSYARFSQGLQLPLNQIQGPSQPILLHPLPSPSPLPQFLQLTKEQPPQLFQPVPQLPVVQPIQQNTPQPQLQPLSLQPLFQPLPPQPTVKTVIPVAPLQPLFTVSNQSPQRLGIIIIRQGTNQQLQNQPILTTRSQNQPSLTTPPQNQTPLTTRSQNEQAISNRQPQVFTSPTSQPTNVSQELNDNEVSTVSTNFAPRSTSEYSSQSTKSSTTVSIVLKAKTKLTVSPSPNSPPEVLFSPTLAPLSLPPQPVTEAPLSTVPTSIQPHSTLAPVSQPQPTLAPLQTSEPQLIQLSTQPPILSTLQPVQVSTSLQPSPTQQPFPVTQQSLATLRPTPVTQQQQETPGIKAIPVQRFQIQSEPLIQVQPIEQQQPLQGLTQPALPIQIQLQPTPSPPSQQLQNQFQPQSQQQHQFQSQAEPQQQSQSQQKSQFQPEKQQNTQTDQQQHPRTVQSQQDKEAATVHAQELLYDLYSFSQPVYSEAQEILIQEPHFKAASISFPSSYSPSFPTFQSTPVFSTTQYFGNYAQDIFGGPHSHHHHYKKK